MNKSNNCARVFFSDESTVRPTLLMLKLKLKLCAIYRGLRNGGLAVDRKHPRKCVENPTAVRLLHGRGTNAHGLPNREQIVPVVLVGLVVLSLYEHHVSGSGV
jgi:hypothetical protein